MISAWFYLLLLGSLCSRTFAAPCEETDPELTAGYFEGDIILDARHWPNATVPYLISEEFDAPFAEYIVLAMRIIESASCVRFVPATDEKFYLFAIPSAKGCSATLGYGKNVRYLNLKPVELDKGCFRLATIQHELLHSLGFHHQQSSPDRDEYVRIMEENIIEGSRRMESPLLWPCSQRVRVKWVSA